MTRDDAIDRDCPLDLTIASIFQNEAPYLKEWIEFHKMLGVQRFILVEDRSTDNFEEVLRPYVDSGNVDLLRHPCPTEWQGRSWRTYQCSIMQSLCNQLKGRTRWLAFIDIDEFIVPARTDDLVAFLHAHEDCGAVYLRWEPFGTSCVRKLRSTDLLVEKLTRKWRFVKGQQMLGKSIVKPHRVSSANIHQCELMPGHRYFDSNPGMEDESPSIRLNHYWARDEHFLLSEKLPRMARNKGWEIDEARTEYFKRAFNDVLDDSMTRFIPELRARMFPGR